MLVEKKLRDVTPEEYNEYSNKNCNTTKCKDCIFYQSNCSAEDRGGGWIFNKDLYSDKFLDQTIEVEVPDILDKEEKEYLKAVIKPFRKRIKWIKKVYTLDYFFIQIATYSDWDKDDKPTAYHVSHLPPFKESDKMYENMEFDEEYKLEELGL